MLKLSTASDHFTYKQVVNTRIQESTIRGKFCVHILSTPSLRGHKHTESLPINETSPRKECLCFQTVENGCNRLAPVCLLCSGAVYRSSDRFLASTWSQSEDQVASLRSISGFFTRRYAKRTIITEKNEMWQTSEDREGPIFCHFSPSNKW